MSVLSYSDLHLSPAVVPGGGGGGGGGEETLSVLSFLLQRGEG